MPAIYIARTVIYVISFVLSFQAMQAFNFELVIKKNRVKEAQLLYWLLVLSLTQGVASFLSAFVKVG